MKTKAILISIFLVSSFFPANLQAMDKRPKTFPIELKVDFGPAQKPAVLKSVIVEKGMTPKDAVSQVFPVQSGMACCSLKELIGIDGTVIDPARNRWWTCSLNGSKKLSPHKKKLKAGDVVEWKYAEESQ